MLLDRQAYYIYAARQLDIYICSQTGRPTIYMPQGSQACIYGARQVDLLYCIYAARQLQHSQAYIYTARPTIYMQQDSSAYYNYAARQLSLYLCSQTGRPTSMQQDSYTRKEVTPISMQLGRQAYIYEARQICLYLCRYAARPIFMPQGRQAYYISDLRWRLLAACPSGSGDTRHRTAINTSAIDPLHRYASLNTSHCLLDQLSWSRK